MFQLVIFDVDGTLAESYTLNLLPGVKEFFEYAYKAGCPQRPRIAIATNQGGVGMRHWMEKADFGKPEEYPTQEQIEQRIQRLVAALGGDPSLPVYVSFSYQTRRGKWSPVPREERSNPRWDPRWRKPQPGMLLQAMADAGVEPHQTLFVGDSQEDQDAAIAAGCAFEWAGEFFGRQWKDCEQLKINLIR